MRARHVRRVRDSCWSGGFQMMNTTVKQAAAALPGIGFSLLPKMLCPACWPAYAGIVSALGLGFLISGKVSPAADGSLSRHHGFGARVSRHAAAWLRPLMGQPSCRSDDSDRQV